MLHFLRLWKGAWQRTTKVLCNLPDCIYRHIVLVGAALQDWPQKLDKRIRYWLGIKVNVFRLQARKEKWKRPLLFLAVSESASWWRHECSQGWATPLLRLFSDWKIKHFWVITGVKQPQPSSVVDKAALLDSKLEASSYSNFPTLKRPFADASPPGYCCCGAVFCMSPLNFWGKKGEKKSLICT